MEGKYIKSGNNYYIITRPELWAKTKTEAAYFSTLREQQKKVQPEPVFNIPDSEPGIIPGEINL